MSEEDGVCRTLALLADVAVSADAALVLRHAEREAIPPGSYGNDVPLTERGAASASRLGEALLLRAPATIRTSPLHRCVQTAEAIISGADWISVAEPDRRLGDPGAFVTAPELAGPALLALGPEGMAELQLAREEPPPGMRATGQGVELLLDLVTSQLAARGLVSLFVTHDLVLAVLVGSLYGLNIAQFDWPEYLDALVLWQDSDVMRFRWRGLHEGSHPIGG